MQCHLPDGRTRDGDKQMTEAEIRELLGAPRTVAMVGMSPSPDRPSRRIGLYLHSQGFKVLPIHPTAREIAGLRVYSSLDSLRSEMKMEAVGKVDVVDVCVAAERAGPIADQAARLGARVIWFQPGAENPQAERRTRELGLAVVSGRCIMADHMDMFGS
jgi:hypothetical protein